MKTLPPPARSRGLASPFAIGPGLLLAACTWFDGPPPDDTVVKLSRPGEEGDEILAITARDLRQALARRRVQLSGDLDAPPLPHPVQRHVLDELVASRLFGHEAARLGVTVSSTVVQAELTTMLRSLPPAERKRTLNQTYQTEDHLAESIRRRLLEQALLEPRFEEGVSRSQVEAAWASWPDERKMRPPRVEAAQIVVASEQAAKEAQKKLREGASFEEVAVELSVAPNALAGGYLGWFTRKEMPEIVDETCFSLKPGEVSGIVPSEYGYHLFKVYERQEGRPIELDEVADELRADILDERVRRAREELLAELKAQWSIVEDEEAIREVFQWGR